MLERRRTHVVDQSAALGYGLRADHGIVNLAHRVGDRRVKNDNAVDRGLGQDSVRLEAKAKLRTNGLALPMKDWGKAHWTGLSHIDPTALFLILSRIKQCLDDDPACTLLSTRPFRAQ